jgi:N utilization substance protein B
MRKRTLAREAALQMLYQAEFLKGDSMQTMIMDFWESNSEMDQMSRDFAEKIVYGVTKHLDVLDELITRYAQNWNLSRMAIVDRNVLRLATFELLHCDDIPPKVTINEAVNLAKRFSQNDSGKFVNGILDRVVHSEESLKSK